MLLNALIGLAALLTVLTLFWALSVRLRDTSIVDILWGPGFVLLAWVYVTMHSAARPRALLVAWLVTLWGVRLALHIYRRHRGEDPRYVAMRRRHGERFWWKSLFVVFWLQGVILWFVAWPLLMAIASPEPTSLTVLDGIGVAIFAIGFLFEAVGDHQLTAFRRNPGNRGTVLSTGLWRYTRHPNYFGDALLWWGLFTIACAVPGGWRTIGSPLLMTWLLMRVSGVTLLEEGLRASRPGYADYVARTSAFVPWFPRRRSPTA